MMSDSKKRGAEAKAKTLPALPATEEMIADALNEQGYLLHHKITHVLQKRPPKTEHAWDIEASELPVSLPNGNETRIDLVLKNGKAHGSWRIALECKRSARDYKRWVFFGEDSSGRRPSGDSYYIERAKLTGSFSHGRDPEPPLLHWLEPLKADSDCPVFEYGLEARLNREGRDKKASATTAIEDAFQQVTLGLAGLSLRIKASHEMYYRLIPMVVTTAELFSASFKVDAVSLEHGIIKSTDLALAPRRWLAVNYRVNDTVCQASPLKFNRTQDLAADLASRQVRTVFVTQAEHLHDCLTWLQNTLSRTP